MLATPRRRVAAAVALLLLLALLAFFIFRAAQPKPGAAAQGTASLTLFIGTVQVTKSGSTTATSGHTGDQLGSGDTLETGDNSKAAINYADGSVTRLDSDTKLQVTSLAKTPAGGTQVGLGQAAGKTWHNVRQLASGSTFTVKGPNSTTAEVRGTEFSFYIVQQGGQTLVVVDAWSGTVAVTANGVTVTLSAGQTTTVAPGAAPTTPSAISAADKADSFTVFNQTLDATAGQPVAFGTGTLTAVSETGSQPGATADGQSDLFFTNGWPGSEFQLEVDGPGGQSQRARSKTPPVTITVPCADAGQWTYKVKDWDSSPNEVWWVVVSKVPHGQGPTPSASTASGTTAPCAAQASPSPTPSPSESPSPEVTPSPSPLAAAPSPAPSRSPSPSPVALPSPSPPPPAPPVVTSVNPNNGPAVGGTSVTINGSGFTGVTGVSFGAAAAASFAFVSASQVTAVSPVHVGATVDVRVTTAVGTSAVSPADQFTFTNWTNRTPASLPAGRVGAAMAYDQATNTTLLFGGSLGGCCNPQSDTWSWNGSAWTQLSPGTVPPARQGAALAYDPVTKRLIMFGGESANFTALGDFWSWNGSNWSALRCRGTCPAATVDPVLASNGSGLVLFRGNFGENDTWTSANGGLNWTQVQGPCSGVCPPTQPQSSGFPAIAPGPGGQVVLVNPTGSVGSVETWIFNGSGWTLQAGAGPPNRQQTSLAYDSAAGVTILFGGCINNSACGLLLNDTWRWNGSVWVQDPLAAPNGPPPARATPMLAGDPTGGVVLFDGGLDDTWVYV